MHRVFVLGKKCSGAATGNSRRSPLPCFMISVMSVLSELATFNKIEFDFHLKFGTTIFE